MRFEPSRNDPTRSDAIRSDTTRSEPSRNEPKRNDTMRRETIRLETTRFEPSRTDASRDETSRNVLKIEVPGNAVSFGSKTTLYRVGGRTVRGQRKTDAAANWEAEVRRIAAEAWSGPLLAGPVEVSIEAIFSLPRSKFRKRKPVPRKWKTTKPDGDKIDRLVHDALAGVVYYHDAQVARHVLTKMEGAQGESARTIITVEPLHPNTTPASYLD